MAFIKLGDEQPITTTFDDKGKKIICPRCKKPIVMVFVDEITIRPSCACEETTDAEQEF